MTPHETLNSEIWWMLQAVKKESLIILKKIEFSLYPSGEGVPSQTTQRNLLYRLHGWHLLDFVAMESEPKEQPTKFYLTIDWKHFNNIYQLYKNGIKFGIEAPELFELANRFVRPMSYSDPKPFEAWEIIRGKVKPSQRAKLKSGAPSEPIFQLSPGTKWEDIEVKFRNPVEIEVFVRDKFLKSADCQDAGFFRSRTQDRSPDKQWSFLRALAAIYTVAAQRKIEKVPATIADLTKGFTSENAVMTIKKKLSRNLQAIFGIGDDPFDDYDQCGYYRTRFKLVAEPELRSDKPFEFGESYDDTRYGNDDDGEENR